VPESLVRSKPGEPGGSFQPSHTSHLAIDGTANNIVKAKAPPERGFLYVIWPYIRAQTAIRSSESVGSRST
jgi:hypothetical protein